MSVSDLPLVSLVLTVSRISGHSEECIPAIPRMRSISRSGDNRGGGSCIRPSAIVLQFRKKPLFPVRKTSCIQS